MSDQATTQTIRIVIDARPAKEGGEEAKRALQGIEQQTGKMSTQLERMENRLSSALGGMKRMAVAAAVAWGVSFGAQALHAAAGLDELSEQLGVTTRFMQASQLSASQNGAALAQLEAGYGKFSQKMGEAADGTKAMIDALDAIGVKNLDLAGKLRPTEDIMQDVAAAIAAMEDPAKKAAAAVDFFGKSGMRLLPMMGDLANGADFMAAQAERLGTMIDQKAIKKMDEWADRGEIASLKLRASFVNGLADIITWLDKLEESWNKSAKADNNWIKNTGKEITSLVDTFNVAGVRASAMFIEAFAALPEQMGKLFKDAMNAAIGSVEWGLNAINRGFVEKAPWAAGKLGVTGDAIKLPRLDGGGASWGDYTGQITAAGDAAAGRMTAAQALARKEAEYKAFIARQAGYQDDEAAARVGRGITTPTRGASTTAVKGAGDDTRKKIDKLLGDGQMAVDFGGQMAAASLQGARAVEELEARYKATKAAQDAYGESAKANAPAVQALADKLYELGKAADKAKNLTEFRLGTENVKNETQVLEAEVRLANELPEIRARELAILRVTQEVKKKGLEDSREDIEARIAAVTQQDLLKQKIEETKKVSEMWLEPVKGALQSIQSTAADAWQGILESGTISFQSLGDVFKKTIIRMAAEFLALATVRPVMSVLIQGAQGMGFMSAGQASSMGYGGGAGGGMSMPSMGGMGGGSGMFGFLNNPISPGSMPAGVYGPAAPGLGGMTWGQGLAGVASIGMGAFQMATSKSTAGKIGGGLGMLGGGIGMASAAGLLPMLGSAGGPIGMGLGIAGMLLPALFGGGEAPALPPLAGSNLRFDPGTGGYSMADTQQNGGGSIAGQYGGVGATLDSFFNRAGGITNAGNAFGMSIWSNQREGTTSGYLLSPTQGSNQQIRDLSGDPTKAIDRLVAKVFYDSIQNNAAMNASPTLRTAFSNREPDSTAAISALLDLVDTYDELGKVTSNAEKGLKEINDQFASLTAGANEWGLSLKPILDEQKKLTTRFAQDFVDNLIDPMAVSLRAFEDEKKDILAGLDYIKANTDVHVDMARANEALLRREAALKEQLYGGAVAQLEEAIKKLSPGGALSNLDPSATLAGMKASYRATYAQAAGGDAGAIGRLAGEGSDLAGFGKSYFAGSPEYNALRDEILANFRAIQVAVQGPISSGGAPLDVNAAAATNAQMQQLMAVVQTQSQDNAQLRADLTRVTALLSRYLTNQAA